MSVGVSSKVQRPLLCPAASKTYQREREARCSGKTLLSSLEACAGLLGGALRDSLLDYAEVAQQTRDSEETTATLDVALHLRDVISTPALRPFTEFLLSMTALDHAINMTVDSLESTTRSFEARLRQTVGVAVAMAMRARDYQQLLPFHGDLAGRLYEVLSRTDVDGLAKDWGVVPSGSTAKLYARQKSEKIKSDTRPPINAECSMGTADNVGVSSHGSRIEMTSVHFKDIAFEN